MIVEEQDTYANIYEQGQIEAMKAIILEGIADDQEGGKSWSRYMHLKDILEYRRNT